MANFNFTKKAVEDLSEIWNYTLEKWSENQADKYYDLLLKRCKEIADNPDLGRKYEGITTELYGLKSNRHIIFYRKIIDKPIEIARILHEQMDLKSRINE